MIFAVALISPTSALHRTTINLICWWRDSSTLAHTLQRSHGEKTAEEIIYLIAQHPELYDFRLVEFILNDNLNLAFDIFQGRLFCQRELSKFFTMNITVIVCFSVFLI